MSGRRWLPVLARIHLWIGVGVALPLMLLAATGAPLVFKDLVFLGPELKGLSRELEASASLEASIERSLAGWLARHGSEDWAIIYVASRSRAVHIIDKADGSKAYLPIDAEEPLAHAPLGLRIEDRLYYLHTELLLGAFGKTLVKIAGPLAAVSIVIGLVIWWPRRSTWRWRDLRPSGLRRLPILRFHTSLAALAALLVACNVFSGALLAHNPTIRASLRPLAPDTTRETPASVAIRPGPTLAPDTPSRTDFTPGDFPAAIAAAQRVFPDGRIRQVARLSDGAHPRLSIKLRLPGEKHPNGRSNVTLDVASGRIESSRDARAGGIPAAYDDFLYAFHIADLFGPGHGWVWLLSALSLIAISAAGALAWLRR